jgi:hypothetical protein
MAGHYIQQYSGTCSLSSEIYDGFIHILRKQNARINRNKLLTHAKIENTHLSAALLQL